MRFCYGLLVLLAGCAAGPHITQLAVQPSGKHPVTVDVLNPRTVQVECMSLNEEDGKWILAGRLRCRGRPLLSRAHRTFELSALDAEGKTVFSCFVIAKCLPGTMRYKGSRRGTFRAQVPDPNTYDRIRVVFGSYESMP